MDALNIKDIIDSIDKENRIYLLLFGLMFIIYKIIIKILSKPFKIIKGNTEVVYGESNCETKFNKNNTK